MEMKLDATYSLGTRLPGTGANATLPLLLVSGSDGVDELKVDGHDGLPGIHLLHQHALHLLLRHGTHVTNDLTPLSGKMEDVQVYMKGMGATNSSQQAVSYKD